MWKATLTTGLAYCSYRELHKQVTEALVPLELKSSFLGNSIVINRSGLALTAKHCTEGVISTEAQFIKIIAKHPDLDIALLQLPRNKTYSMVKLGDSSTLTLGDRLVLFGFFVRELVVSSGYYQGSSDKWLFSSCQMRHGQSGGPVVNENCEVVGINSMHYPCTKEKTGIAHYGNSMHIPINTVKDWLRNYCDETEAGWSLK